MANVTGTVEATNTNFGKFNILVDGKWYNTKEEWASVRPNKGDTVSFDDGGKNYLKRLTIVGAGTPATSAPSTGRSKGGYRANGEKGGFPIHPLAYERALDRRNALNVAATLLESSMEIKPVLDLTDKDLDNISTAVLTLARKFEAYSTGDLEREMAEKMFNEDADNNS